MITVHYLPDSIGPFDGCDIEKVRKAWHAGLFKPVAEVASNTMADAWRTTQNVNESWSQNPHPSVRVIARSIGPRGLRSSMVGDVFVRDGKAYAIAMIGFEEI